MSNEVEIKVEDIYTAILYGDGAALPNPGFYGSGVHGYIFNHNTLGKKDGNKPKKSIISNIGYIEDELIAKYKDVTETVIPEFFIDAFYSFDGIGTNNIGELNAFIFSIGNILEYLETEFSTNIKNIIFKTDSTYLIGVVNNIKTNSIWKADPNKPNLDRWHLIEALLERLSEKSINCELVKVLGHSTSLGNHLADRLALLARTQSARLTKQEEFKITPSKKYWNGEIEKHPFLAYRQLFFTNSIRQNNTENIFAVMNYKKDVEPGKKTHEACFGLIILNDKIDLIEGAINAYQNNYKTMSVLSSLDIPKLFSNIPNRYYSLFGESVFMFNKKNGVLSMLEDPEYDIVNEIRPNGLANKALEKLLDLYKIVLEYKNIGVYEPVRTYIDITDKIYGLDAKDKPVTLIQNGVNNLNLTVTFEDREILVPLELGRDILDRNSLKRMEKEDVEVVLVLHKITPSFITYYTIINLKSRNDISLWHNFYTNNILIPAKK